jgi:phage-related minor tail protein
MAVIAFATNPIGLVILAIAGLIAIFTLLYKNSEGFRNFIDGIINKWRELATAVVGFFKSLWSSVQPYIKIFVDHINLSIEKAKTNFSNFVNYLKGFVLLIVGVFTGNKDKIKEGFKKMFDSLPNVFKDILNGVIDLVNNFVKGFNETANKAENIPGVNVADLPTIPKFARGGDFVVPPGYPNDSFLMGVQSGERVIVQTPQQQQTDNRQMNSNNKTIIYSSTPANFIPNFVPA